WPPGSSTRAARRRRRPRGRIPCSGRYRTDPRPNASAGAGAPVARCHAFECLLDVLAAALPGRLVAGLARHALTHGSSVESVGPYPLSLGTAYASVEHTSERTTSRSTTVRARLEHPSPPVTAEDLEE